MKTNAFTDKSGAEWAIEFDLAQLLRIRKELDLDFINAHNGEAFAKLLDDEIICDCVWLAIEGQAEERGVTKDDFQHNLDGETIDAMESALLEGVVNFFRPSKRPTIRKMVDLMKEVQAKGLSEISSKLSEISLETSSA